MYPLVNEFLSLPSGSKFADFDSFFESDHSLSTLPRLMPTGTIVSEPFLDQWAGSAIGPKLIEPVRFSCPDLFAFVCNKRGDTHDPTGYVKPDQEGENQVQQIFRLVNRRSPDFTVDQVHELVAQEIFTPRRRKRIELAFHQVEHAIERFIDRQSDLIFTPAEKEQIRSRLKSVELQLPPPASLYADEIDLLKRSEVIYERAQDGKLRLRVGGAYVLIAKSWFNL